MIDSCGTVHWQRVSGYKYPPVDSETRVTCL